jgi:O-methyltransferase
MLMLVSAKRLALRAFKQLEGTLLPLMIRDGWRPPDWMGLAAVARARMSFAEEDEIKRSVALVASYTMVNFERLATLWEQVRYLDRFRIAGALVECGVWRGGAVGMMALAHLHDLTAPSRELHLFDSFQGLPEPQRDADGPAAVKLAEGASNGSLRPIGHFAASQEASREMLEQVVRYPAELLHYHAGWFQNIVPRDAPTLGQIALLRLDGDFYQSTRVCLENLYSHVAKGGLVVIDDYGDWQGCRRAVDEFLATQAQPILLNRIDYLGARYWIKP